MNGKKTRVKPSNQGVNLGKDAFRTIFQNSLDAIFWADYKTGKILQCNRAAEKLLQKPCSKIIGAHQITIHPPDKANFYRKLFLSHISKRGTGVAEAEVIAKSGQIKNVIISSSLHTIGGHKILQGVFHDITKRKKTEEKLSESESKYRMLTDNIPVGVFIHQGGKIKYFGKEAMRLLRYSAEEGKDAPIQKFIVPSERKRVVEIARKRQAGKTTPQKYETKLLRKDGKEIDVLMTAMIINYEGKKATQGAFIDITDKKKFERDILFERDKARTYLDVSGVIIVAINSNGKVTLINQKGCEILGYSDNEIVGKKWFNNFLPARTRKQVSEMSKNIIAGKIKYNKYFENPILTKSGEERLIAWHGTPLTDGDGRIVGHLSSGEDITEKRRAEKILEIQKALAIKLSIVSRVEEALMHILDAVTTIEGIDCGGIYLVEKDKSLTLSCHKGLPKKFIAHVKHYTPNSPNSKLVRKGKPIYSTWDELQTPKNHCRGKEKLKSIAVLPIMKDGKAIACLNISSHKTDVIPTHTRNALEAITSQVAGVISRADTENKLSKSEKRYRGLIESQTDLIVRVNPEGHFTFVNNAYCKKFGKSRQYLLGRKFQPLVHKDDIASTLQAMKALYKPPYRAHMEQRAKTANGWRWISWEDNAVKDEDGKIVEIQGVGRDITDRKNAEKQVIDVKNHLETVLDGISESIVVLDRQYNIVSHNHAFQRWVNRPGFDCVNSKCFNLIHGYKSSCRNCPVREVFKSGKPSESIHYHQTRAGRVYHETRAYPIHDGEKVNEAIYVFRDVTDREIMKEQLRQNYEQVIKANEELKKLDKMKTEFLAIASHELRTPVAIIKGYADILSSGVLGGINEQQKMKLIRIESNAQHLNQLVNNILDLTRMDAGEVTIKKTRFLLDNLLREVSSDLRNIPSAKNINFTCSCESGLKLTADRGRIKQVLINLIDNAFKFTPDGGKVSVYAKMTAQGVLITVSDTGIGIKRKDVKNIFRRFYQVDSTLQRRYKGSGLGLAVCERIIQLHNGTIIVRSRLGKGTKMRIYLPL